MFGDQFGEPDHGNVHLVMFQPFFQDDATVGAGSHQPVRLDRFQLEFLSLEGFRAQFLAFLDRRLADVGRIGKLRARLGNIPWRKTSSP